jgi:hypothetical protein
MGWMIEPFSRRLREGVIGGLARMRFYLEMCGEYGFRSIHSEEEFPAG